MLLSTNHLPPDILRCRCGRPARVFMVGWDGWVHGKTCLKCADGGKGDFERRYLRIVEKIMNAPGPWDGSEDESGALADIDEEAA